MTENPFRVISRIYHEDAEFRAAADKDARSALAGKGVHIDGPGEVRLAVDTGDTTHIVFPSDPNAAIPSDALDGVAGGWGRHPNGMLTEDGVHYTTAQLAAGGRYNSCH